MKKKNITVYYSDENDVMDISVNDDYGEFYGEQDGDYIELKDIETDKIIGYTILNYEKHLKDNSLFKMPWRKVDFVVEIAPVIAKYFEENYEEVL